MDPAPSTAPPLTAAPPARRWTLKAMFSSGLRPRELGWAVGWGVALGVAPIPGLQMLACCLVAWLWRLNLPLMLLASNVSFGPLLLVWAAVAASLGAWMTTGAAPWVSYDAYLARFAAGEGFSHHLAVIGACFADWLLGSIILMPVLGGGCGLVVYGLGLLVERRRRAAATAATTAALP